jgi:hypothetical protein
MLFMRASCKKTEEVTVKPKAEKLYAVTFKASDLHVTIEKSSKSKVSAEKHPKDVLSGLCYNVYNRDGYYLSPSTTSMITLKASVLLKTLYLKDLTNCNCEQFN